MLIRKNGRAFECVVVDVNTQRDFCELDGAFPVHNVRELLPQLRRVIAWAKRNHAPIVSSVESHRPFELSDSGYPICCCVDGSGGQRKLEFTVFALHAWIEADNTFSLPIDLFSQVQQVIFHKRSDDLLNNPKADRLLSQVPANEFVLFGTGVECSVKALALALIARGKQVTVVRDACGYWNGSTADLALRQIVAKGAQVISVDELLTRKLDRQHRYPHSVSPETTNGRAPLANPGCRDPRLSRHPVERPLSNHPIAAKLHPRNGHSRRMKA